MAELALLKSFVHPERALTLQAHGATVGFRDCFTLDRVEIDADHLSLEFGVHWADRVEISFSRPRIAAVGLGPTQLVEMRMSGEGVLISSPLSTVTGDVTWSADSPLIAGLLARGYWIPALEWHPWGLQRQSRRQIHLCDRNVTFESWVMPARGSGAPALLSAKGTQDPVQVLRAGLSEGVTSRFDSPAMLLDDLATWLVQRGGRQDVLALFESEPSSLERHPLLRLNHARMMACDDPAFARATAEHLLSMAPDRGPKIERSRLRHGCTRLLESLDKRPCWIEG